ncbi:hypothetical protein FRC10_004874 [Ceratobasidium sp. 414]|nr:hypothetical protein FRC10_004874 [Ceratobasidium sp. 414]
MRQKRTKAYKKLMALYSMSFGFRQPYQVLIDSTFCIEVFQHKIDPAKQLATVLQDDCKLTWSNCISLAPLRNQLSIWRKASNEDDVIIGKQLKMSPASKVLWSTDLRSELRKIPAVPVVHVNRSVMVLEPCSEATMKAKNQASSDVAAMGIREPEARALASTSAPAEPEPVHRRKIAKAPNPLSVKKKKTTPSPDTMEQRSKPEAPTMKPQKRARSTDERSDETREATKSIPVGSGGHKRRRRRKESSTPAA